MEFLNITISDSADQRLDRWLKRQYPSLPQAHIQRLLRKGDIRVNKKKIEANYRLQENDIVTYPIIASMDEIPQTRTTKTSKLHIHDYVIYKDENIFVLNKPQGIAVQGGTNIDDSIADALPQLQSDGDDMPRLVHRLDKDTSGLLVIARNLKASQFYTDIFKTKKATKLYWAICCNIPGKEEGSMKAPLLKDTSTKYEKVIVSESGKEAETRFKMLDHNNKYSLLELEPLTGRTHQLRVHCAHYGFPVYGDGKYGGKEAQEPLNTKRPSLHLHAKELYIPNLAGQKLHIMAPLPSHFIETCKILGFTYENDPLQKITKRV